MRWLMGPAETVSGHVAARVRDITAPNTATATLQFASGALGAVSATTACRAPSPAELNLHFEHGTIRLQDDRIAQWQVPGVPEPTADESVGSGSADPRAIGMLGHRRQWSHIVEKLRAGEQPEVSGADALKTSALVAAIHASSARGGVPVAPEVS